MTQKRSFKQYLKEFKKEDVSLVTDQCCTVPKAVKVLVGSNQYALSLERKCREEKWWHNFIRRRAN
jgi:hypothetical protein